MVRPKRITPWSGSVGGAMLALRPRRVMVMGECLTVAVTLYWLACAMEDRRPREAVAFLEQALSVLQKEQSS